jgi:hypothetical protein
VSGQRVEPATSVIPSKRACMTETFGINGTIFIVTGYRLDDQGSVVRFQAEVRIFPRHLPTLTLGPTVYPVRLVRGSFPGVKGHVNV